MDGLMLQQPLLVSTLLTHAERHLGSQQIVSRRVEGDVHRYTYRELGAPNALSGSGPVLHSLNPRLHPNQVVRPRRVWRAKVNTRGRTRAQTARTSP